MFSIFRLNKKSFGDYARLFVLLLLVVLVVGSVAFFHEVLLPFFLAIFLAYLLAPVIDWLSAKRIRTWPVPRGLSIMGVYTLIFGLLILSGYYLFPRFYIEVNRMVKTLPAVLFTLEEDLIIPFEESLNDWLEEILPPPDVEAALKDVEGNGASSPAGPSHDTKGFDTALSEGDFSMATLRPLLEDYRYVIEKVDENRYEITPLKREKLVEGNGRHPFRFNQQFSGAFAQFRTGLESNIIEFINLGREFIQILLGSFFKLFLVFMICGFILLDPRRINSFLCSLIPQHYHSAYNDWVRRLDTGLSGVVRGQALICLVNGVLTGIGIAILGVPFVVTLSVMAAVFSLVPIFGVLISTIPILLMALTVSFSTALLALAWILIIHFIEGNMLNPKIMGDSAKIHPVLIVFALVVGQHFAGVMGALLAVPIFSLIQNSFLFLAFKSDDFERAK